MSDVVRAQLTLQPIYSPRIRHCHYGSIVNEPVNWLCVSIDFLASGADLLLRAEIELEETGVDARNSGFEHRFGSAEFGEGAAGEGEFGGSVVGKLKGDLRTDGALCYACDEDWVCCEQ